MLKDIFYKIMTDKEKREEFFYLDDQDNMCQEDMYEFFCQQGYKEDSETFKDEMKEFLGSPEAYKIERDFGSFTLSEEMLNMVAGGQNVRKLLNDGLDELKKVCKWNFFLYFKFKAMIFIDRFINTWHS